MSHKHHKQSFKPTQQKAPFLMHHPNTLFRHQNRGAIARRKQEPQS